MKETIESTDPSIAIGIIAYALLVARGSILIVWQKRMSKKTNEGSNES